MGEAKKAAAPVDWGREGARCAGVADEPHRGEPELRNQVRAIVSGADNRAVGALQKSLKAAPAAGAKLAKSRQSGFGASLALLAQLDAGATPAGRTGGGGGRAYSRRLRSARWSNATILRQLPYRDR